MKLTDNELSALRELLNSDACMKVQRADLVSRARNDATANWIENFMRTMYEKSNNLQVDSHLINEKTGKPHTVETMVESLQERVGLNTIQKEASAYFPLTMKIIADGDSKKKESDDEEKPEDDELLESIKQFVDDMFSSHRGYVDNPAVIYALREKFGPDKVSKCQSIIDELLNETRSGFNDQNIMVALPTQYLGQPMKADPQGASMTPLFENIKGLG